MKKLNQVKLPKIDLTKIPSLSKEVREKLKLYQPKNLGQALNISGITPAAIMSIYNQLKIKEDKPNEKRKKSI